MKNIELNLFEKNLMEIFIIYRLNNTVDARGVRQFFNKMFFRTSNWIMGFCKMRRNFDRQT
jgi:hypothetical protein